VRRRRTIQPSRGRRRDAKARAAEEFNIGNLSSAEKARIDSKADEILGEA
jgi:hypothetical protein